MLVAVVVLSALTLWTLRSLLPAMLLGAWLAAVTEPASARLARRLGGRTRAATALTLLLVLSLIAFAAVLALPIVADLSAALRSVRHAVASGQGASVLAQAVGHATTGAAASHAAAVPPPAEPHPALRVLAVARELAPLAEGALAAAASVAIQLFVFVITAYYLAIDGRRLQAGIERVSPFGAENTRKFIHEFVAVGRGIALSMGLTGLLTATVLGLTFRACGAPRAFLLGAIAFVAAMLPIGAHVVWIPVAAYLMWQGHPRAAVALAVVGIVGIGGVVDHVVRPWLVRFGRLTMHPLLTVLGLFGGVVAFGAWGVFIGPLLVAMTATALRIHAERPILARRSLVPGERVTVVSAPPDAAAVVGMLPMESDGMVH